MAENKFWLKYGTDKIEAEKALEEKVLDAYIIRPPYLYGSFNNVYREAFVFDCAMKSRPFYLPCDGEMKLQFLHVKDLCRIIERIIETNPSDHIINVGNSQAVSIKDWVKMCYKACGKAPSFVNVTDKTDIRNYFCFYDYEYFLDVSRQRKLLDGTIPLEEGLKESFEWYKENEKDVRKKPYIEYIDEFLT